MFFEILLFRRFLKTFKKYKNIFGTEWNNYIAMFKYLAGIPYVVLLVQPMVHLLRNYTQKCVVEDICTKSFV